jgi:hypothetical protein
MLLKMAAFVVDDWLYIDSGEYYASSSNGVT